MAGIRLIIQLICLILFFGCSALTGRKKSISHQNGKHIQISDTTPDSTVVNKEKIIDLPKISKRDSLRKQGTTLSPASKLMIEACDNYVKVNPENPKVYEVMQMKAAVYYNNKLFDKSRKTYQKIIDRFPNSYKSVNAIRMTAQSFYSEKKYENAQLWFRKLKKVAHEDEDKTKADSRIAESIFRIAEMYENEGKFKDAAINYERIALEFPKSVIADVSLFNAGMSLEKTKEFSRAILMYQRLNKRYQNSKLAERTLFRTAKCYEKLLQWEDAARTYLLLIKRYPSSDFSSTSLYNAGFCFENVKKYKEAAMIFEKMAKQFPESKETPDVLFKAAELYGHIKEWTDMARVIQIFTKRYGQDKKKIVHALCMAGIALKMQNKPKKAIIQLKKAITIFSSIDNPGTANKYYTAKAQFTIGEIHHEFQNNIKLFLPRKTYNKLINTKSHYLNKAIEAYAKVVKYNISEWTTHAIYQIGQSYEDFGLDVFNQQRPKNTSLNKIIALEISIAEAIEEYFVNNAMPYFEQNVKLGIKENIENEYILNSKKKLTYLPLLTGQNYLVLAQIAQKLNTKNSQTGFALIAYKLEILQKIAPYQEHAISLLLKSLEMASTYHQFDEYYKEASKRITETSFEVAETYSHIVKIARDAPIPSGLNTYERLIYKTKLLKQIEQYEENAVTNSLKVLKISQAYNIKDIYTEKAKNLIPKLLFNRGRCYDFLCLSIFQAPPYPSNINEEEKEEYRARFEEIALKYQDNAFDIYKTILDYTGKEYAAGEYVNHAYVRLYQNFPDEFGYKQENTEEKILSSGPKWKCTTDSVTNWNKIDFNDSKWHKVSKGHTPELIQITGFPDKTPKAMWCKTDSVKTHENRVFFRRIFYLKQKPLEAKLYLTAINAYTVFINGNKLHIDSMDTLQWNTAKIWDVFNKLKQGKNVLAVKVINRLEAGFGLFPYLPVTVKSYNYLPKFPGTDKFLDKEHISEENYVFPEINNFSIKK